MSQTLAARQESWPEYVQRISYGKTRADIARAAGIDPSAVSRWLRATSRPRAEKVVSFARGLQQNPIEGLIAAGYLDAHEVEGVIEVNRSRADLSDQELLTELSDRLAQRPASDEVDNITAGLTPTDDLGESGQDQTGLP